MRASMLTTVRATVTLLAACACMMHAPLARAAPFELEWSAAEGCPSRERIVAATRARLGESESSAPPELFVHGTIAAEDGALVVDLQVKDAAGMDLGERRVRFEERNCQKIEEPTALLLAMMIAVAHPRAAAGEPAPEPTTPGPEPAPEPASKLVSTPAPARPPTPPPAPARKQVRLPMTLGVSAVASLGLLPNVGLGGALRWTATLSPPVVLGVEGSFEISQAARAGSGEATFRFLDAGALAGVRIVRSRRLEIVPLLEARGGLMTASTTGFPSSYDATRFVGVVGAGALGRLFLGPALHLEVLPDVRVPLVHDEFEVREGANLIRVHRPAPVEARLSLGIAWSFR